MPDADSLIQHYLEGTLSDAEAEQLHALLLEQPEIGQQLLTHLDMDAMLRATKPLVALPSVRPTLIPKRRFTFAALTSAAAVAACITLLGAWAWLALSSGSDEPTTSSVAVLTRGVGLEWEKDTMKPVPGAPLSPGWLRLKSGLAQIEFYQGARVAIEGPAAFQLLSSGEAFCASGKLSAHVPPQAKGFRINTPKGTIVDLGTEFGLDVNAAGAEVHVFKGEVELHRANAAMQSLKEGQAMALTQNAPMQTAKAAPFASLTEIDQRTAELQRSQLERWQAASSKINSDPSLLLRFDFQDAEETRSLYNHARHGGSIPDGSIVGCSWTQGRWPGKKALEFRNVSDRVRVSIPGELESMTLAAWVRVNGLDRSFNGLFMSESWGDRKIHWQITREGKAKLGVANFDSKPHTDYDSPYLFTAERFGQWTHLAVVYDPKARQVRHYANGQCIATLPMKDVVPLKIGLAELGNWNNHAHYPERVAIRHLSGAMDEFSLYSRVLSDAEIAALAK